MTVRVASLKELSTATVRDNQQHMTELLKSAYPELDTQRGSIHDIICFLSAGVVGGVIKTEMDRAYASRSLLAVRANPTKFDADVIDHILSNFLIARGTATKALGTLTVVLSQDVTTIVPSRAVWIVGTNTFETQIPVIARVTGGSLISANDRPLVARGDGTYEFTLPVIAAAAGLAGNLRANTAAAPDFNLPNFVRAFCREDFTGGKDDENVTDLLARIGQGVPAKVAAGGNNVQKLLQVTSGYTDAEFSIVGFGDKAQLRDKRSVFPISFGGGRVDVYARTAPNIVSAIRQKTGTLLQVVDANTSLWQVNIARVDFPGCYSVSRVQNPRNIANGDLVIEKTTRSYDHAAANVQHDIQQTTEAFLSIYQTLSVTFYDSLTPTSNMVVGESHSFDVTLTGQPGIDLLQSIVDSTEHRAWDSDLLIKAAVPADVFIDLTIANSVVTLGAADVNAVKAAAAKAATLAGFPGKLYISSVVQAVVSALPSGAKLEKAAVFARILQSDGKLLNVADDAVIAVPNLPDLGITPTTVGFFCHTSNVVVSQN